MHPHTTAGISGGKDGAYSIVMSGGYSDDHDMGDFMCATDPRLVECLSHQFAEHTRELAETTEAGGVTASRTETSPLSTFTINGCL